MADEIFPDWKHLPPRLASQFGASLPPLGCTQLPIQQLAKAFTDTAVLLGIREASALTPIFIAASAAHHVQLRLSRPGIALPCDEGEKSPSAIEWALFVALLCARSPLPASFKDIVDSRFEPSEIPNSNTWLFSSDEQSLDYSVGVFLYALTNQQHWVVSGRPIGKLARLLAEIRAIFDPTIIAPLPVLICRAANDAGLVGKNLPGTSALSLLGSRAAYAVAYAAGPQPDKLPLAALFGHPLVRDRLRELTTQWTAEALADLQDPRLEPFASFVTVVTEAITTKINGSRLFGLMASNHPPVAELHRSIDLARSLLQFDPNGQSAWEVQRWGDWSSVARIGRVFPVGLAFLPLARMGQDMDEPFESMITRTRRADGWRYYEDWAGIPPDTDDLGLVLRLFALLRQPTIKKTIFRRSFDLVRAAMEKDGEFPVWLEVGLDEPISKDAPNWQGPRCVAVAAQFVLGLLEAGIDDQNDLRLNVLEWIVRSWENHKESAVFHYTWPFARLLLAKLMQALLRQNIPDFAERFQTIAKNMVEEIQNAQHADGGWGTPLATACHLAILAQHAPSFDPWPSLTYLGTRQGPDGAWPSEPLYRCPGKDGAPMAHGSAILTTGICLDALLDVRDRLEQEKSAAAGSSNDSRQRER